MAEIEVDYIVVGAGSSGCVIASRLTEDPDLKVLLLEAGPDDTNWQIDMPLAVERLLTSDQFNWNYETQSEALLGGRRIGHPRGRVLGGSSSINGMVYTRGHALDYENWAKNYGCDGWRYADVLPYFIRSETATNADGVYRGSKGPLRVGLPKISEHPLNSAFIKAGAAAGYPVTKDSNGYQQEGFGPNEFTISGGKRWSASRAYLSDEVRRRGNLVIKTGALVERVLLRDRTAYGVRYTLAGSSMDARAAREVILCGGAFNSPQLLQLSGIGPAKTLQDAGVQVIHELSGVGQNLQDHPDLALQYQCKKSVGLGGVARSPGKYIAGANWFLRKTGPCATNQFEAAAFIRSSAGVEYPDIKLELLPLAFKPDSFEPYDGYSFQIHMTQLRPRSRGSVSISSNSAQVAPSIKFNYLSDPEDIAVFRRALALTREVIAQKPLDAYAGNELSPGREVQAGADVDAWIHQRVTTAFHPSCTCRMGCADDAQAVVTPDLKVIGIENLRVADASVMPHVVSANTNAPSIMIGEMASDLLRGRKLAPVEEPYYVNAKWREMQR